MADPAAVGSRRQSVATRLDRPFHQRDLAIRPADFQLINRLGVAKPKDRHRFDLREIRPRRHDPADHSAITHRRGQYRANTARVAIRPIESNLNRLEAGRVVAKNQRWTGDLRDDEIKVAIEIEIAGSEPTTNDRPCQIPRHLRGNFAKATSLASGDASENLSGLPVPLTGLNPLDFFFQMTVRLHQVFHSVEIKVREQESEGE